MMLPDFTHWGSYNDTDSSHMLKGWDFTPTCCQWICDPLKQGAQQNHGSYFQNIINYCLQVDSNSGKQKRCTLKGMLP